MVRIQFKSNTGRVRRDNGRFLENVPVMEEDVARRFADDLEEAVKQSIRNKFDRFSGELHDNVKADKVGSTSEGVTYEVSANAYNNGVNYAAWHEYATEGHGVVVGEANSPINAWARQKNIPQGAEIFVTPMNRQEGSFMAPAVRKAIKKARRRIRSGRSSPSTGLQQAFS